VVALSNGVRVADVGAVQKSDVRGHTSRWRAKNVGEERDRKGSGFGHDRRAYVRLEAVPLFFLGLVAWCDFGKGERVQVRFLGSGQKGAWVGVQWRMWPGHFFEFVRREKKFKQEV
jgi:hypothetical protein